MRLADDDCNNYPLAGTVSWDAASQELRWSWEPNALGGFVVYLMVVDDEVKKAGKAEDTGSSTCQKRMLDEFRVARQVIVGPIPGKPLPRWRTRPLDPFKQNAPTDLLAGRTVHLRARSFG